MPALALAVEGAFVYGAARGIDVGGGAAGYALDAPGPVFESGGGVGGVQRWIGGSTEKAARVGDAFSCAGFVVA